MGRPARTSARDVDFGTVGNECLCNHKADSGAAASDECSDVGDIEELGALKLIVAGFAVTHGSDELIWGPR